MSFFFQVTQVEVTYRFTFAVDRQALLEALRPVTEKDPSGLAIVTFANLRCFPRQEMQEDGRACAQAHTSNLFMDGGVNEGEACTLFATCWMESSMPYLPGEQHAFFGGGGSVLVRVDSAID